MMFVFHARTFGEQDCCFQTSILLTDIQSPFQDCEINKHLMMSSDEEENAIPFFEKKDEVKYRYRLL